jgi:hypothetical protein
MPVLINDFDLSVEPPQPSEHAVQKAPAPQPSAPPPRPLSLEAAEQMLQQMYERRRRTWAD